MNDKRAMDTKMKEAKKGEVCDLVNRGTWKVVLFKDILLGENVLTRRLVLSLQSIVDKEVICRARSVIVRHLYEVKRIIFHSTSTIFFTISPPSSCRGSDIWLRHVNSSNDSFIPSVNQTPRSCNLDYKEDTRVLIWTWSELKTFTLSLWALRRKEVVNFTVGNIFRLNIKRLNSNSLCLIGSSDSSHAKKAASRPSSAMLSSLAIYLKFS